MDRKDIPAEMHCAKFSKQLSHLREVCTWAESPLTWEKQSRAFPGVSRSSKENAFLPKTLYIPPNSNTNLIRFGQVKVGLWFALVEADLMGLFESGLIWP